jgi:hypothetical protein
MYRKSLQPQNSNALMAEAAGIIKISVTTYETAAHGAKTQEITRFALPLFF